MTKNYINELKSGYISDTGTIKTGFIDGFPQELAKEFNSTTPKLSVSQSRALFDIVNGLYGSFTRKSISFDEAKMELSMLKSRINDKVNKGNISQEFFDFFTENIEAVKSPSDFRAFKYHFEALCNYLKDDKAKTNQNNSGSNSTHYNNNRNNYNNNQYRQNFR